MNVWVSVMFFKTITSRRVCLVSDFHWNLYVINAGNVIFNYLKIFNYGIWYLSRKLMIFVVFYSYSVETYNIKTLKSFFRFSMLITSFTAIFLLKRLIIVWRSFQKSHSMLTTAVQLTYQQPAQNGVLTDQLCRAIYCSHLSIMPMQISIIIT